MESDVKQEGTVREREILRDGSELDFLPEAMSEEMFSDFDLGNSLMDFNDYRAIDKDGSKRQKPKTAADFEAYLSARLPPEEPYGMFSNDITMCRCLGTKGGDNLLADIERKNAEQGMGNVAIPNTNIRLINYSVCPKCGKIFSFKDLAEYYRHPKNDDRFRSPGEQARGDTRVFCSDCETWFLPALIIVDDTPKNEVQFLCRNQTMDAIEYYFFRRGKQALTKNRANILYDKSGLKAVKNDIHLGEMEQKPTLIVNLLQYTPANLTLNLIDGTNVEKGDVLYGWWGKGLA